MTRMSVAEAGANLAETVEQVQGEPVVLESDGRPVAVVLSFETYQRLTEPEDEKLKALTAFWDREIERRMADPVSYELTEELWAEIRRDDGEELDPDSLALPPRQVPSGRG